VKLSEHYLQRFQALHPVLIDLSLGRIERLLTALGHPERQMPKVIHVGGTNGKRSSRSPPPPRSICLPPIRPM